MIRIVISLFLSSTVAAAGADGVLRDLREINSFSDEEFAKERHFELKGTVPAMLRFGTFVLESGGTRCLVFSYNQANLPQTGDEIVLRGCTTFDRNCQRSLWLDSFEKTGSHPPEETIGINARQLREEDFNYRRVKIRGTVTNAYHDEIDYRWDRFSLRDGSDTFHAAVPKSASADFTFDRLIGAEVELVGVILTNFGGRRTFLTPIVTLNDYGDMRILTPTPNDPFDVPAIENLHHLHPNLVMAMGRRRTRGTVLATWHGDRFLMKTAHGQTMRISTAPGKGVPGCGESVEVSGFPETDLFHINFGRAVFRVVDDVHAPIAPPQRLSAETILMLDGKPCIQPQYHGCPIVLRGTIRGILDTDFTDRQFILENGGFQIPVDCSSCPDALPRIGIGYDLEVSGICLMDTESWQPSSTFPRLNGFTLILRSPDDMRILSKPSWWTPRRLSLIIFALLASLAAIFIWNRTLRRLVERRGRELLREEIAHASADLKVEERTRLAVELHDTIAQNLTGLALQIDAAQMAAENNAADVLPYIETLRVKMRNCRNNLRDCLWDLRSRAFEEKDLSTAIQRTLAPHLGDTTVNVDCPIRNSELSDNTIHAILGITRELVTNAIRHGKASVIDIRGRIDGGELSLSVADDGCGFDPTHCPGPSQGHFGLQGVEERIRRLGGTWRISSAPGRGTTIDIRTLNANG